MEQIELRLAALHAAVDTELENIEFLEPKADTDNLRGLLLKADFIREWNCTEPDEATSWLSFRQWQPERATLVQLYSHTKSLSARLKEGAVKSG